MINAFSVDLEDWFCVYNLKDKISRLEWDNQEKRIEITTTRILDLLEKYDIKATFFVLGWVAERYPELIKQIDNKGHEIGTHGYSHKLLTEITPEEFDEEISRGIEVTAKITKQHISGFRAPSFTITKKTLWGLEILKKYGITYDSSVFPMGFHPEYGIENAKLEFFEIIDGVMEVPMSCAVLMGKRIPCCGGGYFRLYPYKISKYLMKKCNEQGRPVIFYIHPWEIDEEQPKINLPVIKKFRHYNNINKTFNRLENLLKDFKFVPINELLRNVSKHS